jgi:hypothetical protein
LHHFLKEKDPIFRYHTLQPSQSRFTEDRVFIPRTCSICREAPTVAATALSFCLEAARNLVRLF